METKPKILLVDDKKENLIALEDVLNGVNCHTISAMTGNDALKHCLNHKFALILLDVRLPDMTGFDVADYLSKDESNRSVPIIFLTAHDYDQSFEWQGYDSGAVDFMFKPLDAHILRSKVQVFLELHDKNQQLVFEVQQRKQAEQKIRALAQKKDEFLAICTHDLKSPLGIIKMAMDVLQEMAEEVPNIYADFIQRSSKQADFALLLISDLLELNQVEHGLKLDYSEFFVKDLIMGSIEQFDIQIKDRGMTVKTQLDEGLKIKADYNRITQVVNNILSNAIKYSEPHTEILIRTKSVPGRRFIDGRLLHIIVKDQGQGIPKNKLRTVFNKYEQAKKKHRTKGTGLGLAIAQEFCKVHRGKIMAHNDPIQGAVFTIILPNIVEAVTSDTRKTILVATAEIKFKDVIESLVDKEQVKVLYTGDGLEALYFLRNYTIDLFLTEISLKHVDGIELCQHVVDNNPLTPIVFLRTEKEKNEIIALQSRLTGDIGCLVKKPLDQQALKNVIAKLS